MTYTDVRGGEGSGGTEAVSLGTPQTSPYVSLLLVGSDLSFQQSIESEWAMETPKRVAVWSEVQEAWEP